MTSLGDALANAPVLLDGGLSTQLEAMGHDISGALWSARLLLDEPDAVVAAHAAFFAAGAQVATSATYQASVDGFTASGLARADAAALLRRGVRLAARARDAAQDRDGRPRWVAASVGPYGAVLADGSEYRGDYGLTVAELRRWHRPRLQLLAGALDDVGGGVLACETVPCLAEAEALLAELATLDVPAWLSLSVTAEAGAVRTRAGEPVEPALAAAAEVPAVLAAGVNCCDPAAVGPALQALAGRLPGVAYPNSGQTWDAAARAWSGSTRLDAAAVTGWVTGGAALVGGCCRVRPGDVADMARALRA